MEPWPFAVQPIPNKPPLPAGIPEEWQKANAALQAVKPPKVSAASTTPSQEQNGAVNNEISGFGWTPAPMFYPGFTGYPQAYPYYNYNYNYVMNNNPYYMNPMTPTARLPPPQPSSSSDIKMADSTVKVEEAKSENVSSTTMPTTTKPTPSSPPAAYFTNIANQAPGSGNIKFNLPKKKNQNNNFQLQRQTIQERMNTFKITESPPDKDKSLNVPAQQNMLAQKSVSSVSPSEYPPALKNYVGRCFDKCKTDIDKDQVEIILRGKLCKAQHDGTVWTKDWDNEPLPNTHSDRLAQEEEKKRLILEQKVPNIIRNQNKKTSPTHSRNYSQSRNRAVSHHSRSRSPSRSRSRSPPPPRKVFRRRKYSSSSESSGDSRSSKKTLSSSVIGPSEIRTPRNTPNNFVKNKKKKKGNKRPFTVEPEFCTDERLQKRAARFEVKSPKQKPNSLVLTITNNFVIDVEGDELEWGSDAVMGTSEELVKPFLRLTGAVDPTTVRPEDILEKSLAMVKKDWLEKQDYHFACEQLKSIRQDLVVQCIRNNFTVQVYETHARIALEKGDHTEFNQCQSQLKALYQEVNEGNRLEFTGYHILYTIYTESTIELKNILTDLKPGENSDEVVSHALKIAKACSSNNYCRFFKLYLGAPKMSSFIIDWFIEKIRKAALKAIIKSFRPNIPVSHIQSALAFPSTEECMAFLTKANLVFVDAGVVNCKESVGPLANF